MRTRQDKARQLYLNALDMGCGFIFEGDDHVIVMAPTTDGKGKRHDTLQAVINRYQDIFVTMVPRHGVQADRLRPAPRGKADVDTTGDKMAVIRRGIEGATKQAQKKKAVAAKRKPAWKAQQKKVYYEPREIYEP